MTDCKFTAGETYRTRDGREARIYATDGGGEYPIHGAVPNKANWEMYCWRADGAFCMSLHGADLMPPKREVWIALYRNFDGDLAARVIDAGEYERCYGDGRKPPDRLKIIGPVEIEDTE